jgi:hypothetical protein
MRKPKFTYKKTLERQAAAEVIEKKRQQMITETIMGYGREHWLKSAKQGFPPLHGENLDAMTTQELTDHISNYDIDFRTMSSHGKPFNKLTGKFVEQPLQTYDQLYAYCETLKAK